jgi:hypothetical protein
MDRTQATELADHVQSATGLHPAVVPSERGLLVEVRGPAGGVYYFHEPLDWIEWPGKQLRAESEKLRPL